MKRYIEPKLIDLWAMAVDPDYAYLSPELAETMKAKELAQSGESNGDWVAREYRRIG